MLRFHYTENTLTHLTIDHGGSDLFDSFGLSVFNKPECVAQTPDVRRVMASVHTRIKKLVKYHGPRAITYGEHLNTHFATFILANCIVSFGDTMTTGDFTLIQKRSYDKIEIMVGRGGNCFVKSYERNI